MEEGSSSSADKPLTPKQALAWRVMTLVATVIVLIVIGKDHDIREPFVAGTFLAIVLAIAFFTRKFIRDNSDENGRLLKRK